MKSLQKLCLPWRKPT